LQCDTNCTIARTAIAACGLDDTACYCSNKTTIPLQNCEQCLFTALIAANKPAPDPRAGSNVALGGAPRAIVFFLRLIFFYLAWATNCGAAKPPIPVNPPIGLAVPDSWDGPFVAVFPTTIGWVIAVTGGVLGSSLIYMLCNM
jgi:hypothetical protein